MLVLFYRELNLSVLDIGYFGPSIFCSFMVAILSLYLKCWFACPHVQFLCVLFHIWFGWSNLIKCTAQNKGVKCFVIKCGEYQTTFEGGKKQWSTAYSPKTQLLHQNKGFRLTKQLSSGKIWNNHTKSLYMRLWQRFIRSIS